MRNFSSTSQKDNLFESADYFKETSAVDIDSVNSVQQVASQSASQSTQLPYYDFNDTAATFQSLIAKDPSNLTSGTSTYGLWEYISYLDDSFYELWLACAEPSGLGLGLGMGLILSSFMTKAVFTPFILYSQQVGIKMKLLQPDNDEIQASMKRYSQQGVSSFFIDWDRTERRLKLSEANLSTCGRRTGSIL